MLKSILCSTIALAFATGATFAAEPAATAPGAKGGMFVDAKGMTLYTFDKDTPGKSACNGQCATNWPPLLVPAGTEVSGDFTLMDRTDTDQKIVAYKGWPLYFWVKDTKPGDTTGDGFLNGAWHIAKP